MIADELRKLNNHWAKTTQPKIQEASVLSQGGDANSYNLQLKSGAKIPNVYGPVGISTGKSVAVSTYPGTSKCYIILGESYSAPGAATVITV